MKKFLASALSVLMLVSMLPMSVFAANTSASVNNAGFTVTSDAESTLAPGVTMNELVVYDDAGRRVEMFVATVDTTVETVSIYANYKNNQNDVLGMQTVREQAAAMEANYEQPFQVVAAINASYYNIENGKPTGAFVMEGKDITTESEGNAYPFFAVLNDGSYMIGSKGEYSSYKSQIKEAIGGWIHLVKDGAVCAGLDAKTLYPRQTIGLTADGKVILLTADGQNDPISYGITVQKQAELMLEMGCVEALHLDGGSSATFLAKREGTDTLDCINTPAGGTERAVSNSLMIVSTAVADGTFDHAVLTTENEYVTPGSTVAVAAIGVDAAGGAAEIPEGVSYQLADSAYGTVTADGVFTSNGTVGDVVVQMLLDGAVVGETTVHVVIPENISFGQTAIVVPFGREITLSVTATYGAYQVALQEGDIAYTLGDSAIGRIDGNRFTAAAADAAVTESTVTATFTLDPSVTTTAALSLGKGSEVIQDYEGYEVGAQIYNFKQAHSYGAGDSYVEVVDSATGKVRNGDQALAIHVDGTEYRYYNGFSQNRISDIDVDNLPAEATALGMWIYIPEEAQGLSLGIRFFRTGTNNTADRTTLYLIEAGQVATFELPGWRYFTVDLSTIKFNFDLYSFELFMYEDSDNVYGTDLMQEYNTLNKFTIYIDDITLDYSQAVDDREVPEFEDIYLSNSTDGVVMKGQTVDYNSFSAYVQAYDYAANNAVGLDLTSAKAYVDGVDVTDRLTVSDNGLLSLAETVYSEGAHTFLFEIADKNGNVSTIQRHVTVDATDADAAITILPQDPDATDLPVGSTYWIDVKVAEIENVRKVVTAIELDGTHDWVLDFMEVADGFAASYELDEITNDVTLTIEKTGSVSVTGEGVLVSIPIHTWEYEQYYNNQTLIDPGVTQIDFAIQNTWARAVKLRADYGVVTFANGSADTFAMAPITTATEVTLEINANIGDTEGVDKSYHIHKAEAVADKAATCTENGYTGRTVCAGCYCGAETHTSGAACGGAAGCGSPVEWGTVIPATGHTYAVIDGVLQCEDCDQLFNGTYTDGEVYVDGVAVAGWVGESYYVAGKKLVGVHKVAAPDGSGEYYYDFGENGVCAGLVKYNGLFYDEADSTYRYSKLGELASGWQLVGEDWYYFEPSTMAAASGTLEVGVITYEFEEDGKLTSGVWAQTLFGMRYYYGPTCYSKGWQTIDGKDYFFENSVRLEGGWQQILESQQYRNWYYFNEDGSCDKAIRPETGFYTDRNGLGYALNGSGLSGLHEIDGEYYYFDHHGYAQTNGTYAGRLFKDDYAAYTGLMEQDGVLYYYVDGRTATNGLYEIDGSYYYVYWGGIVKTDGRYYVGTTFCDLPAGTYTVDAEGKLLNGVVQVNGASYLYINGNTASNGLYQIDDDYYYSYWGGVLQTDGRYYVSTTYCDLPAGNYTFGADGKMLNGVAEVDGALYLYINGTTATKGLYKVDGDYYYSYWGGVLQTDGRYYVSTTFCDLPAGNYTFGADGKMLNGAIEVNGTRYLYVNGTTATKGLYKVDDDYYYSYWGGVLQTDGRYYVSTTFCDLPAGNYTFDADGKMLNGVETVGGTLYLYINGTTATCGLYEIDGEYYYSYWGGVLKTDGKYYVGTTFCDLPAGNYTFAANGKMLNGFVTRDDGIYYYENGKPGAMGIHYIDGEYYFVKDGNGKLVTNQKYYAWEGNGYTIEMNYTFDETGKVIG